MTLTLRGASKNSYEFTLHDSVEGLSAGAGCYVFVRETSEKNKFFVIYIGHTGDLSERFDSHHKWDCITKQEKASHIGLDRTRTKAGAKAVEDDLLEIRNPPCNG